MLPQSPWTISKPSGEINLGSRGRCNTALLGRVWVFVEGLSGCLPAEGLAWSVVECETDGVEIVSGVSGEVGAFREVLA